MDWAGVAKAALWLGLAGLAIFALFRLKRSGRIEERLDQAKDTIKEAGDAARIKRDVDAADPDTRQRMRDEWTKK